MDALDKKIVLELMHDCRQPYVELASKLGISVPTLKTRMKKLEESGVIESYITELSANYFREGFAFSYVRVKKTPGIDMAFFSRMKDQYLYFIRDLAGDYAIFFDYDDIDDLKLKVSELNSQKFIASCNHFVFPFQTRAVEELDVLDWKLLKALRKSPRIPYKELSKIVQKNTKIIGDRVISFKERGIVNFTLNFNPLNLKDQVVAFLLLELEEGMQDMLPALLKEVERYYFFPLRFEMPPAFLITLVTPSMAEVQQVSNSLNTFDAVLSVRPIVWKEFVRGSGWTDEVIESHL